MKEKIKMHNGIYSTTPIPQSEYNEWINYMNQSTKRQQEDTDRNNREEYMFTVFVIIVLLFIGIGLPILVFISKNFDTNFCLSL